MKSIELEHLGTGLFGRVYIPKQVKGVVVFSHGLMSGVEESQRWPKLRKQFHLNQLATVGSYYPAHGKRKNQPFSFKECISTLEQTLTFVHQQFPSKPVFVLGTSAGSSVILSLHQKFLTNLRGVILFSLMTDLTVFSRFTFEPDHYQRWQSYGYSKQQAELILSRMIRDGRQLHLRRIITHQLSSHSTPLLLIHGKNDRVTPYTEIVEQVNANTQCYIFGGAEATHDLRGQVLHKATALTVFWIKQLV